MPPTCIPSLRITFLLALALLFSSPLLAQALPARFEQNRVFVEFPAPDGQVLSFFTDTGGGYNAITHSAAAKLRLTVIGELRGDDGRTSPLLRFPDAAIERGIPRPRSEAFYQSGLKPVPDRELSRDGFLGSRWFAGEIWAFDYGRHTLEHLSEFTPDASWRSTDLGFRQASATGPELNFPRLTVVIAGQKLDLLLDTGATTTVSQVSAPAQHLPAGTQTATSFITRRTLRHWHAQHPEWPLIEAAEQGTGAAMMEVPQVEIAGLTIGPVWFTERKDEIFRDWMAQMTDKPIEGALGGSAFRYLRMVLDYPGRRAHFQPL